MLHHAPTLLTLMLIGLLACNGGDERTTYQVPGCKELPYKEPGKTPYFGPCGCGSREGEPPTDWELECISGDWNHYECYREGDVGSICLQSCTKDSDCLDLDGWTPVCKLDTPYDGRCSLPCEDNSWCPSWLACYNNECWWPLTKDDP